MRPIVLEAWRDIITAEAARRLPEFEAYGKRERGGPRGALRYQWRATPTLSCYVLFRPIDSEAFDIYAGWSTLHRCPFTFGQSSEPDDFNVKEAMFASIQLARRSGAAH
jgi:hypothetical protein